MAMAAPQQRTITTVRSHQRCTRTSLLPPFLDTVDVILQMLGEAWSGGQTLAWVQVIANPAGFLGPIKGVGVDLLQDGTLVRHEVTNDVGGAVFSFQATEGIRTYQATARVLFASGELECSTAVVVKVNQGKAPEVLRMKITSVVFDPLNLFNYNQYLDQLDADLKRQAPDARVVREESSYDGRALIVVIESPAILVLILAIFIIAAILVFLLWMLVDRIDAVIEERGAAFAVPFTLIAGAALVGAVGVLAAVVAKRFPRGSTRPLITRAGVS